MHGWGRYVMTGDSQTRRQTNVASRGFRGRMTGVTQKFQQITLSTSLTMIELPAMPGCDTAPAARPDLDFDYPTFFNTSPGPGGGEGLPGKLRVFCTLIVPSGSIQRFSTMVAPDPALIVVTSTSPSHALV